jgi:hypothetical protein
MTVYWTTYNTDYGDGGGVIDQRGWCDTTPIQAGFGRTRREALADLIDLLGVYPGEGEVDLGPDPDRDINEVPGTGGDGRNMRVVAYVCV